MTIKELLEMIEYTVTVNGESRKGNILWSEWLSNVAKEAKEFYHESEEEAFTPASREHFQKYLCIMWKFGQLPAKVTETRTNETKDGLWVWEIETEGTLENEKEQPTEPTQEANEPAEQQDTPDTTTDTENAQNGPEKAEGKKEDKNMRNTTNEAKKALLTINPHALQGLHSMIGYDFQQPHTIAHINGRFTVNSTLKAIGGANRENVVSLLAMDHGSSYLDQLNLVTVDSAGRIDIDHKGGYKFGLNNVHMKGMFEDIRKSDRAECFIICQRSEYVKKPQEKPFDTSARYEYIPGKDSRCGDGHGASWLDRITVRALDGSNARHEVTKDGHKYHFSTVVYRRQNESRPQSHAEILDKSGYLLPERRADLLRRADQLRKERAKAAYQATNNAAKVEELRAMVEAKKAEFAAAIASAADSETLRTAAHELYFKFMWTMSEFERFADKTARRDYVSIEAAESAYTAIKSKLAKEAC